MNLIRMQATNSAKLTSRNFTYALGMNMNRFKDPAWCGGFIAAVVMFGPFALGGLSLLTGAAWLDRAADWLAASPLLICGIVAIAGLSFGVFKALTSYGD
jgi:hypothetical protein